MNDDQNTSPTTSVTNAGVNTSCTQCATPIEAGERAMQTHGMPGLLCARCGTRALELDEPEDTETEFDLFGALHEEYTVRTLLGWPTPPAVLVVDPDLGPTWLVGVDEDPDRPCLARGALNAERLEVTLFRDFEPTSAA